MIKGFTIRIYALIINENNEILLLDEFALNTKMTKFPGGGLEPGESTIDCLKRESIEELGQELEVLEHFYTTDFFQTAFDSKEIQLLSIYYFAKFKETPKFKTSQVPFDFDKLENGAIAPRWRKLSELTENELTMPIDKVVLGKLRKYLSTFAL